MTKVREGLCEVMFEQRLSEAPEQARKTAGGNAAAEMRMGLVFAEQRGGQGGPVRARTPLEPMSAIPHSQPATTSLPSSVKEGIQVTQISRVHGDLF